MENKSWFKYWYPDTNMGLVERTSIESKSGLIVLLSVLCGLCTIYYAVLLDSHCSSLNTVMSLYFFSIPIGMKHFGRWDFFGMAVCIGWMADNAIVAQCMPEDAISLSFYQSLIPSYFVLASEKYVFGGCFVSFLLCYSLPYEYSSIFRETEMMSPDVYKEYLTGVIKRTQFMNSLHLFAVFGLTLWIHKCSNNDLKLMNKLLEETKQAKQAAEMFFAAFSHEFRNPLNSLLGSLELIKDDIKLMPEHSKEFISTAMDCGEVLSNLINNVLDVSKIQAQMFQPAYSKAQPRAILHKVFSISKTICIRKGLTLFLEIDPNLPNFVLLDPGRLTQVLINLVSNSIKFTEEGYVKIKAIWNYDATGMVNEFTSEYSNFMCIKPRCALDEGPVTLAPVLNEKIGEKFTDKSIQTDFGESRAANHKESYSLLDTHQEHFICKYHNEIKGTLIIQVQDSGIGISDENCKKLFNPFTQANSAISKLYGGTGLGLWISKTILNVYKGSLSVKSRINEGSIFTIALPCSVFVSEEPCLPKNTLVSQKLDVLLLDNLYTKLNKIALEEQGVKVSVCISPIHATKYLDSCSFHFIFISINFLSDNLVSLMNRIKRIDEEKKSPIILLVPENKLDRIPLKFKNYSTLVSPLTQRDLNKVIHFMTEKTLQKNLGTVLVLDDDKFILDILSKILEKEKILHKTCSKGLEFIEIYKKNYKEVAVLVLDAHLEDVSGFEVAKIIREFEKTSGIASSPIICISGDNDESHLKKCSEAGITVRRNFYLVTKPVKREDYISTIKRYLK